MGGSSACGKIAGPSSAVSIHIQMMPGEVLFPGAAPQLENATRAFRAKELCLFYLR